MKATIHVDIMANFTGSEHFMREEKFSTITQARTYHGSQVAREPPLRVQKGCGYTRICNSILPHAPLVALCGKQGANPPYFFLLRGIKAQ